MKFNVECQIKASEGQIYGAKIIEAPTKESAIGIERSGESVWFNWGGA